MNMNYSLEAVLRALPAAWGPDTAQSPRSGAGAASGQCAVSSMLIQERFGGVILTANIGSSYYPVKHYWNQLDENIWIDSTRSQFIKRAAIRQIRVADRKEYDFEDTRKKLKILNYRLEQHLGELYGNSTY